MSVSAFLVLTALVIGLFGGALLWWRSSESGKSNLMASTPTSPAGEVGRLAPGTLVEVKGTLRVNEPLIGEFSGRPAAYVTSEIERWTTFRDTNENGMPTHHTGRASLYLSTRHAPCVVQDHSGYAHLDFDGATVEAFEVLNESVPYSETGSLLADFAVDALLDTRSKYRRKEAILIPDLPVYVLGEVRPGGVIGRPAPGSPNKTFVISYKTEEQRASSNTASGAWLLVGALACFVFTAGFLFLAFMLRRF